MSEWLNILPLGSKAAEKELPPETELSKPAKIVRLSARQFKPQENTFDGLRAYVIGVALRLAARLGYVVLLVGPCRSGKSFVLERTCAGAILNKTEDIANNGYRPLTLDANTFPSGKTFAIDEVGHLPAGFFLAAREALDTRRVIYVLQDKRLINALGMGPLLHRRKVLMVNID